MTYSLVAENLNKSFWRKRVLVDINMCVSEGTILALLGPNGAGKTTLLMSLLNLYQPSSGRALILDFDSRYLPYNIFNDVAFVSEQQLLPEHHKVQHLLDYCQGIYQDWDDAYASSLLNRFELDSKQRIKDMSRGNKARLRMLLAMSHHPKILLMDEMFSGLDPVSREDMTDALISIASQQGCTIVFASHEMDEVERLADNVVFLNQTQLSPLKSTENLLETHRIIEVDQQRELERHDAYSSLLCRLQSNGTRSRFVIGSDTAENLNVILTELSSQIDVNIYPADLTHIFRFLKMQSELGS